MSKIHYWFKLCRTAWKFGLSRGAPAAHLHGGRRRARPTIPVETGCCNVGVAKKQRTNARTVDSTVGVQRLSVGAQSNEHGIAQTSCGTIGLAAHVSTMRWKLGFLHLAAPHNCD